MAKAAAKSGDTFTSKPSDPVLLIITAREIIFCSKLVISISVYFGNKSLDAKRPEGKSSPDPEAALPSHTAHISAVLNINIHRTVIVFLIICIPFRYNVFNILAPII